MQTILSPNCHMCSVYNWIVKNNHVGDLSLTVAPLSDDKLVWAPSVCVNRHLPFAFMPVCPDQTGAEFSDSEYDDWAHMITDDTWQSHVIDCADNYLSISEVKQND